MTLRNVLHQDQRFFVIIGAAKAATSALCFHLSQHPQITFAATKEPNFFSADDNYSRGLDWYLKFFALDSSRLALGEGSVNYSITGIYPQSARRIAHHVPDARILYIVREPFARIKSHVKKLRSERKVDPRKSMLDLLRSEPVLLDSARYWKQMATYREEFADDQILVELFEDYIHEPISVIRRCLQHIGVDSDWMPADPFERINATVGRTQEPAWIWRLKQIPALRSHTPRQVKRWLRINCHEPLRADDEWDSESTAWVWERIEDDIRRFLRYCGRAPAAWGLEP